MSRGIKRYYETLLIPISSDDKSKIYGMSLDKETSMASIVRECIKKGLIDYDKEKGITNN